jgi:hypothetical protein
VVPHACRRVYLCKFHTHTHTKYFNLWSLALSSSWILPHMLLQDGQPIRPTTCPRYSTPSMTLLGIYSFSMARLLWHIMICKNYSAPPPMPKIELWGITAPPGPSTRVISPTHGRYDQPPYLTTRLQHQHETAPSHPISCRSPSIISQKIALQVFMYIA